MGDHKSRIYAGGLRKHQMKDRADDFFGDELIAVDIRINGNEKWFDVRISDTVAPKRIKLFMEKYPSCKIIPYKVRQLKEVCKECK